jgi:catabolite repression HPr-like protein
MKKSVVVKMQQDFEARPIANLVQVANRYESKIYLEHGDSRVNAKSIMGMMSLTLMPGEEITVVANGTDEKEAAAGIERFLVNVKNR